MKKRNCLFLSWLLIGFSLSGAHSQNENIKIGQSLVWPDNKLQLVAGAPIDYTKLIVIDFWATWCAPCIAAFPHLQDLQKKYADKIQIIAVSDESNQTVQKFLKKKPYNLSFYNDTTKVLFHLFGITSRPETVLISPDKKFIWAGKSKKLEAVFENYFKGEDLDFSIEASRKYVKSSTALNRKEDFLFSYYIKRSKDPDSYSATVPKKLDAPANIVYQAVPLVEIVQDLTNTSPLQLRYTRKDLDTVLVDLEAKSNTPLISSQKAIEIVIEQLQAIFNFKIAYKTQNVPVIRLRVIDKAKLDRFKNDIEGGGMLKPGADGKHDFIRVTLGQLAISIQNKLKKIVVVESAETSRYDFTLDSLKDFDLLKNQLETQYGISLKTETADVKFTVIE